MAAIGKAFAEPADMVEAYNQVGGFTQPIQADAPLERLVWSLEREVGLPLKAVAVNGQELAVGIDVNALTLNVVARLRALPEIEAAQPNFIHRRMRM